MSKDHLSNTDPPLLELLTNLRALSTASLNDDDASRVRRSFWRALSEHALAIMLAEATSYARRWHIRDYSPQEAVSEAMVKFAEWVKDSGNSPLPNNEETIISDLVHRTIQAMNTAARKHARHPHVTLPSADLSVDSHPSPAEEVEGRDMYASAIRLVREQLGETYANCLTLHTLGHSVREIASKVKLPRTKVFRYIDEALALLRASQFGLPPSS